MKRRERREYSDEFKMQMVRLYQSGKTQSELVAEYELTKSTLYKWIKQATTTGSFKEKENRTPEENKLLQLEKENQQLRMENDILKQAALIMGRK